MQGYTHTGPIDCNKPFNAENLKGKTAIVTGGMYAFLRSCQAAILMTTEQVQMASERLMFVPSLPQGMILSTPGNWRLANRARANVCIGDPDKKKGSVLEEELPR